jgi:hypothetical protein
MTKADLAEAILDLETTVGKTGKGKPPSPRTWDALDAAFPSVHPDLKALWTWGRVGAIASSPRIDEEREASEAYWAQEWLSPALSLSTLRDLREDVPTFPRGLVPLATDEAGNYTCFDNTSGRLMDWDHETRKAKKLDDCLAKLMGRLRAAYVAASVRAKADAKGRADEKREQLAKAKAKAADSKKVAKKGGSATSATGGVPRSIKTLSAPVLRKTEDRLYEYEDGVLSPDNAHAVLRRVSQQTTFLNLATNTIEHPTLPELQEQIRSFGSSDRPFSEGLAVDEEGTAFVLAGANELSLWRWAAAGAGAEQGVALVGRATWLDKKRKSVRFRFADLRRGGRVWLTREHVAVSVAPARIDGPWDRTMGFEEHGEPVVAVWANAALPADSSLESKPKSAEPAFLVGEGLPGLQSFAMVGTRVVTAHAGKSYDESVLRVWELGEATPRATKTVAERVQTVVLRPDGKQLAYLGDAVAVLDETLAPIARSTKKETPSSIGETLLYGPTGAFLVSASSTELLVWDAATARKAVSAAIPDPKYKKGRRHFVKHVTADRVLVVEPALLFGLS